MFLPSSKIKGLQKKLAVAGCGIKPPPRSPQRGYFRQSIAAAPARGSEPGLAPGRPDAQAQAQRFDPASGDGRVQIFRLRQINQGFRIWSRIPVPW
jgi:hypothetical protein